MLRADDRQAVGALEQRQHLADRLDQVAVEVLGDQLGDHLGVGVAVEDDALGLELPLEGGVVLDDAVVDDGDQRRRRRRAGGRCGRWPGRASPSACG